MSVRDSLTYRSSPASRSPSHIVYFIPGNPGLVSYYDSFLGSLCDTVNQHFATVSKQQQANVVFHGSSLAGFEIEKTPAKRLNTLEDQLDHLDKSLSTLLSSLALDAKPRVILIGHSVGTYLLLEHVRRWTSLQAERGAEYEIAGAVCLFPTVVDILKSPNGQRFGWLLQVPLFWVLLQLVASLLTLLVRGAARVALVKAITKMPDPAATVTATWLASSSGVAQSVFMGGDEMERITRDSWARDVWVLGHKQKRTWFLFGKNDEWVAEETREQVIAARGKDVNVHVDDTGLPHSFPLSTSPVCVLRCASGELTYGEEHAKPVAEKVHEYLVDIITNDLASESPSN